MGLESLIRPKILIPIAIGVFGLSVYFKVVENISENNMFKNFYEKILFEYGDVNHDGFISPNEYFEFDKKAFEGKKCKVY